MCLLIKALGAHVEVKLYFSSGETLREKLFLGEPMISEDANK